MRLLLGSCGYGVVMRGLVLLAVPHNALRMLCSAQHVVFRAADPDGFLGLFDGSGNLCASVSLIHNGDKFAFLGLYICRK